MAAFLRSPRFVIPLLAVLIAVSVWLNWPRSPIGELPRLSGDEVAGLADDPSDRHRMVVHMSSLLLRRAEYAPWTELPPVCQPLWATLFFEIAMERGAEVFVQSRRPTDPTPVEVADAYEKLGAAEMAAGVRQAAPDLEGGGAPARRAAFDQRYRALLPAARAARVAYQKQHAAAIQAAGTPTP